VDRRAVFFIVAAMVCALLIPVTPDKFRWVGELLTGLYIVLSLASLLDHVSRVGLERNRRP
jgi:predicted Na+-dependent transporter